jgi:hypothetical protein
VAGTVGAVKVRRGLYELRGIAHTRPSYPGAAACGGRVYAEWFPGERDDGGPIPPSWECYCEKCLECDPNGWATLAECRREAPGYWPG